MNNDLERISSEMLEGSIMRHVGSQGRTWNV